MEVIKIIIEGVLMGLGLSFVVGPALFALIQTSLTSGFKAGVRFAIGISISDILMVSLVTLGVSTLFESGSSRNIISIVGGIIMIVFGVFTFFQKVPQKGKSIQTSTGMSYLKYIGKGFLFNIANPGVWFYWVMPVGIAATMGSVPLGGNVVLTPRESSLLFLVALLAAVFTCDVLKCAIAYKLKTILLPKVIHVINKIVGVILIVFGVYLVVTVFVSIPNPVNL
ncbi:MAG: LysE family transporter [Bacteroidales bacterium]|nr:LysE family transporter [Bacteroidales bacterium]